LAAISEVCLDPGNHSWIQFHIDIGFTPLTSSWATQVAVRHHRTANTLLGIAGGPGRAVAAVNGWIIAIHIKSVTTSNIVTHLMSGDNQVPIERSGVLDIVIVIVLRPPAPLQCRDPRIVALRVACSSHIGKTPPADASKKMGDVGSL